MTDYSAELGHVQLEVADLERSATFYSRFLGLRVTERMESRKGRMVLLSGGERHREVTLRAAPGGGRGGHEDEAPESGPDGRPPEGSGGETPESGPESRPPGARDTAFSAPFQVAFEVPDRRAFADLFFELRKEGIPTTAVDHGVSWALYFRDPDGNALEAFWDTREEEDGRRQWGGRSRLLAVDQILSDSRVRELADRREAETAEGPPGDAEPEPGEEGGRDDPGDAGDTEAPAGAETAGGSSGDRDTPDDRSGTS